MSFQSFIVSNSLCILEKKGTSSHYTNMEKFSCISLATSAWTFWDYRSCISEFSSLSFTLAKGKLCGIVACI